jgi:hypothetical protein
MATVSPLILEPLLSTKDHEALKEEELKATGEVHLILNVVVFSPRKLKGNLAEEFLFSQQLYCNLL